MEQLETERSDLVFVLAGRVSRKRFALTLVKEHADWQLLLSVGRFEIRRLPDLGLRVPFDLVSRALALKPEQRHFFLSVCGQDAGDVFYLPPYRWGTLREILGLVAWLHGHPNIRSLIIISSEFHLSRVRLCCMALMPKEIQIKFVPVANEPHSRAIPYEHAKLVLAEWIKFALYLFILTVRKPKPWPYLVAVKMNVPR